jgi:hypothetical protein
LILCPTRSISWSRRICLDTLMCPTHRERSSTAASGSFLASAKTLTAKSSLTLPLPWNQQVHQLGLQLHLLRKHQLGHHRFDQPKTQLKALLLDHHCCQHPVLHGSPLLLPRFCLLPVLRGSPLLPPRFCLLQVLRGLPLPHPQRCQPLLRQHSQRFDQLETQLLTLLTGPH